MKIERFESKSTFFESESPGKRKPIDFKIVENRIGSCDLVRTWTQGSNLPLFDRRWDLFRDFLIFSAMLPTSGSDWPDWYYGWLDWGQSVFVFQVHLVTSPPSFWVSEAKNLVSIMDDDVRWLEQVVRSVVVRQLSTTVRLALMKVIPLTVSSFVWENQLVVILFELWKTYQET